MGCKYDGFERSPVVPAAWGYYDYKSIRIRTDEFGICIIGIGGFCAGGGNLQYKENSVCGSSSGADRGCGTACVRVEPECILLHGHADLRQLRCSVQHRTLPHGALVVPDVQGVLR